MFTGQSDGCSGVEYFGRSALTITVNILDDGSIKNDPSRILLFAGIPQFEATVAIRHVRLS